MADTDKKSFVIYRTWAKLFLSLDNENAGILIKAICSHQEGQKAEIEDTTIQAIFNMIQDKMDEDSEKYKAKVDRIQKINETKSSRNRNEVETKSSRNRNEIVGVTDTVTVTVTDTVTVYKEIFEAYNEQNNLPKSRALTKNRIDILKRLLEAFTKEEIIEVFKKANDVPWLTGKNDKGWRADFDWLINIDNFVRVQDGRYDNLSNDKPKGYISGNYDFDALEREARMN